MKDNEVEIVLKERAPAEKRSEDRYGHSHGNNNIDFKMKSGPSFDEYHKASQRSQALQSVLNQNEDLMARLKTAMFRANDLESQLESKDSEIQRLRKEREDLYEQTLILQEKELIFRERTQKSLQRGEDLKEENAELLTRLEKVERAFRRLFKYREKVRHNLPQLKILRKKSNRLTEINSHLKVQVEELSSRLQKIHLEMSEANTNLIADYEAQLQEFKQKASERDLYLQTKVEFENRAIELERELNQIKSSYGKESVALKMELDQFRKQTKELIVQCETLKSQTAAYALETHEKTEENNKLSDQVESLQILWKEKQEELERTEEKNKSLQKLNQDISLKLNESKREIASLNQKLEAEVELLNRLRQSSALK